MADARTHVGASLDVALPGRTAPTMMRVVGKAIFPFFGRGSFTPTGLGVGAELIDPAPSRAGFNFVLVREAPGPSKKATTAKFTSDLVASQVCPADQGCGVVTTEQPSDVNNYGRVQPVLSALSAVLALFAVSTIAHFLLMSVRRRRRDFAVLKTLGFTRIQISSAVAWQTTIIVGLALLIGLPLGAATGRWAWVLFAGRLGIGQQARIPLLVLVLAIPGGLLIANAVALGPAWLASRLQPASALRSE